MNNALYLIPTIPNHLLINVLSKSKENTFSAIFYSHQRSQWPFQIYFLSTMLKYLQYIPGVSVAIMMAVSTGSVLITCTDKVVASTSTPSGVSGERWAAGHTGSSGVGPLSKANTGMSQDPAHGLLSGFILRTEPVSDFESSKSLPKIGVVGNGSSRVGSFTSKSLLPRWLPRPHPSGFLRLTDVPLWCCFHIQWLCWPALWRQLGGGLVLGYAG